MSDVNLIEYRQQLVDILAANPEDKESCVELICADCLLCEENIRDMGPSWKNTPYLREIIAYSQILLTQGHAVLIYNVCRRASETFFTHPRLKLQLLYLQRDALAKMPESDEPDASDAEKLKQDIAFYQLNIAAADRGAFSEIIPSKYLRKDPVEWTARYEEVIDEAEEKANMELQDYSRGMGFCHAYWHTLARILQEDYDIKWCSPALMNPGVMFD